MRCQSGSVNSMRWYAYGCSTTTLALPVPVSFYRTISFHPEHIEKKLVSE